MKNILIVKLSAIGDVIHTLPALNCLRQHFPDARINWLVEEGAADLLIGHPALDRVIISKRKQWLKELFSARFFEVVKEIFGFLSELRDTRYDLIFDFQGLLKSALLVLIADGRKKVGFGRGMQHQEFSYLFYSERVQAVSMEIHALKRGLELVKALDIPAEQIEYNIPFADQQAAVDQLLQTHGIVGEKPIVAINPLSRWKTKNWSESKFALLCGAISDTYEVDLVFTGGTDDRAYIETIVSFMTTTAANLAGETSLKGLAALYDRCRFVISTDTGPMHIAAAVDTPVVALFGPTAPWRTGPFGDIHHVIRLGLDCSPCCRKNCKDPKCMQSIDVGMVLAEVEKMMESS